MTLLNRPAHGVNVLGDRPYSFAFSYVWNSIPNDVRCAPSLSPFKSRLKTYLFRPVDKDLTLYFDHCAHVHVMAIVLFCV